MKVPVNVKRTEPKKLRQRSHKREVKTKKVKKPNVIGAVLEALFILILAGGFIYCCFFI